jgi:hypothetical protein
MELAQRKLVEQAFKKDTAEHRVRECEENLEVLRAELLDATMEFLNMQGNIGAVENLRLQRSEEDGHGNNSSQAQFYQRSPSGSVDTGFAIST